MKIFGVCLGYTVSGANSIRATPNPCHAGNSWLPWLASRYNVSVSWNPLSSALFPLHLHSSNSPVALFMTKNAVHRTRGKVLTKWATLAFFQPTWLLEAKPFPKKSFYWLENHPIALCRCSTCPLLANISGRHLVIRSSHVKHAISAYRALTFLHGTFLVAMIFSSHNGGACFYY